MFYMYIYVIYVTYIYIYKYLNKFILIFFASLKESEIGFFPSMLFLF